MDTLLEERVELRSIEGEIDQQDSADVYVSVHVSKNNGSLLASVLPSAPLQVRTNDHPPWGVNTPATFIQHQFTLLHLLTPPDTPSNTSQCLGGAVVRASDFWPSGHGFDSQSARYQAPRSTQPSIPPGYENRVPAFTGWVGWQLTVCDHIWQATPSSSQIGFHYELNTAFKL